MGKGDKKTRKGKIAIGSYGNTRKRGAVKAKRKRAAAARKSAEPAGAETPAKTRRTVKKKAEG